jgi:hypothetical protein
MVSKIFESPNGSKINSLRTICEVHREIFDLLVIHLHNDPEALKKLVIKLEEAYIMAKKMDKRLLEQKISYIDECFEANSVIATVELRKLRISLTKVLNSDVEFLAKFNKE